jgi:hypothetical protein
LTSRLPVWLSILIMSSLFLAACGSGKQSAKIQLAPASELPKTVQDAPVAVRTAYQFAVANPDALENVPCYCGCGAIGHTSNLACYVKEFGADGRPVFDNHAMGCSICVDIATDVMTLTAQGRLPAQVRSQIVDAYSRFGPSNQ